MIFFFSLDFYFFNAECSAGGGGVVFFFYLIFFELKLLCTPIALYKVWCSLIPY